MERVGREQCSDLSLRRGLGLEECIPPAFTAMALASKDSQQDEVSSSAGCECRRQQLLLPAISAPSSSCSQQLLLPAVGLEGSVGPHPGL